MTDSGQSDTPVLIDLFCGAGGATKGYQRAGFYVIGVDSHPQPHYCGDEFHLGDALTFPLERRAKLGRNVLADEWREATGIDWMVKTELSQAIPPAFTEWLGAVAMAELAVIA